VESNHPIFVDQLTEMSGILGIT